MLFDVWFIVTEPIKAGYHIVLRSSMSYSTTVKDMEANLIWNGAAAYCTGTRRLLEGWIFLILLLIKQSLWLRKKNAEMMVELALVLSNIQ